MKTPLGTPAGDRLLAEAHRFALRYTCEDCAHFDAERAACGHGYPTEPHRRLKAARAEVVFCKEFEVG